MECHDRLLSYRRSDNLQRVRFRIKHKLITLALRRHLESALLHTYHQQSTHSDRNFNSTTYRRMYQIRVLHDFREQEAFLHIVEITATGRVDVADFRETLSDSCRRVDCEEGVPGPVLVCCVALPPDQC